MTEDVLARLRRVEGQIRGIQHMVERDTPCLDVLTQVAAARAALDAAGFAVLEARLRDCIDHDGSTEAEADQVVIAVQRFVRR